MNEIDPDSFEATDAPPEAADADALAPAAFETAGPEPDLFVVEDDLIVGADDDLFDVPAEAATLPGMDAVDTAAAALAFDEPRAQPWTAAPASEPAPENPLRARLRALSGSPRLWIALGIFGLLNLALIGIVAPDRNAASLSGADEIAQSPALTPATTRPVDPHTEAEPVAETPLVLEQAPASRAAMPAARRGSRARLDEIEQAIAAGRRGFARTELGRLLLDADALPVPERQETRAQAELLVARILQERADEARQGTAHEARGTAGVGGSPR